MLEDFGGLEVVDGAELVLEADVVELVVVVVELLLGVVVDEDESVVEVELDVLVVEEGVVAGAEVVLVVEELLSVGASPPKSPPRPLSCRPTTSGLNMAPCEIATAARRATTDCARNSMMLALMDGGCGVERRIQPKVRGRRDCRKSRVFADADVFEGPTTKGVWKSSNGS